MFNDAGFACKLPLLFAFVSMTAAVARCPALLQVQAMNEIRDNGVAASTDAKALGTQLAKELMSDEEENAIRARRALKDAEPDVSDAVAEVLADALRSKGRDADRACGAFMGEDAPQFGGGAYNVIFRAFMALTGGQTGAHPQADAAMQAFIMRGVDARHLASRENAKAAASMRLPRRVLSVFTRAWVMVVFGLPALFGVIGMIGEPSAIPLIATTLTILAAACIAIDAHKRRCPECRQLLAGKLLSIVQDNYGGHTLSWSCTFCNHRWQT